VHLVRVKNASASRSTRPRSNSLCLSSQGRIDRGEGLGVLQVVQGRARHAFAAHRSIASSHDYSPTDGAKGPVLVRRNSTSTQSVVSSEIDMFSPTLSPSSLEDSELRQSSITSDATDLDGPQSVNEPLVGEDIAVYQRLRQASYFRDVPKVLEEITQYRAKSRVSVPCYNMAMQALLDNRVVGQPISLILELYNEMLERNLIPNLRTYRIMISALCARDADVHRVIASLQARIDRRAFMARDGDNDSTVDQQRLTHLRTENNFTSALTLFKAATTIRNLSLGLPEYNALLRSCAFHHDVEAALRVFAHMERFPDDPPSPVTYALLISVFCNKADLGGAQQVFNAFKEASMQGQVTWDWAPKTSQNDSPAPRVGKRNELSKHSQIQVWNKMIETYFKCGEPAGALDLFESMLDTPLGQAFRESEAPLPNAMTYTSIITGFCESRDVQSALSWFDRLLIQDSVAENPYAPLSTPPRPDYLAWVTMIDTLARMGKVDDLNRLFLKLLEIAPQDGLSVRTVDRFVVFRANFDAMQAPDVPQSRASALLDFVLNHVMSIDGDTRSLALNTAPARTMLVEVVQTLLAQGQIDRALDFAERFVIMERQLIQQNEADGTITGAQTLYQQKGLRSLVQRLSSMALFSPPTPMTPILPVKSAVRVAALGELVGLQPQKAVSAWYIHSYMESRRRGDPLDLSFQGWVTLIKSFVSLDLPALDPESSEARVEPIPPPSNFVYPGLVALLKDLADETIDLSQLDHRLMRKLVKALVYTHGREESLQLLRDLGPKFACLLEVRGVDGVSHGSGAQPGSSIPAQETTYDGGVHIDLYHSRFVEEWYPANPNISVETGFDRFVSGAQRGIYPSPECIGRLIGGLGRLGAVQKVRTLYNAAQRVLAALEDQKRWQSAGWFVIEDQMIIAFAHAGEYEAAHVHRVRIIEQGGTPSADAYGALISSLKDTTDDTSHALQLWEEALARDVLPNIFMYNTIISKLAKARKADHALVIFQQMKEQGVKPSSVTYGALIAACCRVGDAPSAELFFQEMIAAPNYKPRVPPYNTMIQLYVYTKPDRERVLHYYDTLLKANVKPSGHTYKVCTSV
jgi:pentatricopeptide repeat protein